MNKGLHSHNFGGIRSSYNEGGPGHTHTVIYQGKAYESSTLRGGEQGHTHTLTINMNVLESGPPDGREKRAASPLVPSSLKKVSDQELSLLERRVHELYGSHFLGSDQMAKSGINREDVVSAALFIWREMKERNLPITQSSPLWRAAQGLSKGEMPDPMLEREDVYSYLASNYWEDKNVDAA